MSNTAYRKPPQPRAIPRRVLAALLILFGGFMTTAANADEDDDRGVILKLVDTLFDGMREKDETLLRSVFAADAQVGSNDVNSFVTRVLSSQAHLDEVTFDETVRMDGDLAMAWTPYNIFVDKAFHHCGVDLFVMKRIDDDWKITYLADTRRTEGCDPDRRG